MSDPTPVRAGEDAGREATDTGTEWFWRIVDSNAEVGLPSIEEDALRLLCRYANRASAAEAEVARLTKEVEWWKASVKSVPNLVISLRDRIAFLEDVIWPFAEYAKNMPGSDFGEGEIGEYYYNSFRVSLRTEDLKAARAALTEGAPTDV